jgi:hypothetical protein
MMDREPLMSDEQAGEAVARYLEENPELLQGLAPERDLWPNIESRISARVLPMSTRVSQTVSQAVSQTTRRRAGWIPALLAASALIAATASVTYVLTTRANTARVADNSTAAAPAPNGSAGSENVIQINPSSDGSVAPARSGAGTPVAKSRRAAVTQLASRSGSDNANELRQTYDLEITSLSETLDQRRAQLNPRTVATIERNLAVIDEAIRQSQLALKYDPNSQLLNAQLDRTLAKKTSLLRAAVLLPST